LIHSFTSKATLVLKHRLRLAMGYLPAPIQESYVRSKHLKIVRENMAAFVEPAFLGQVVQDSISWIKPGGKPDLPLGGFDLYSLSEVERLAVQGWLAAGPYDSDVELDSRMDNFYDEVGRLKAALRTRLSIDSLGDSVIGAGSKVLFDARSVQSAVHGGRGIGRFALAALEAARSAAASGQLVLLIDRGLDQLPSDLIGSASVVSRVSNHEVGDFGLFIQPSPMTASADPLLPILGSSVPKLALVFDFIPLDYPTVYLKHAAERAEYAANLDALKRYSEFVCISGLTRTQLVDFLERSGAEDLVVAAARGASVAWPKGVMPSAQSGAGPGDGPIVVITGDEPRKNTLGALAAIGAATVGEEFRNVVVLGMARHGDLVHHLAMYAALRPGEAVASARLSDAEMTELLESASAAVVASFDEGLSLPVIEALRCGTPVIASDIPAHRELLGTGSFLADPADPADLARALRKHRGKKETARSQWAALRKHEHSDLETVISQRVSEVAFTPGAKKFGGEVEDLVADGSVGTRRLSIGVATPWEPQKSGVADFSAATIRALGELADVTVYVTSGVQENAADLGLTVKSVEFLFESGGSHDHDVMVAVVGNSHFHLPFVELLNVIDCVVIAHDTRMVEYYMALRGKGGAEDMMLRTLAPGASETLSPSLDEQIDDMRLLQNAGMWEVAQRAQTLILHSQSAAGRIAGETGVLPIVLPFASQRVPELPVITSSQRSAAATRLGLQAGVVHLATFGYVDFRTKLTDVVLESVGWLVAWGQQVVLHVVGAASEKEDAALIEQASGLGVDLRITGFVSDSVFRDYLLAVDIGIQLRVSPLLGVSGPLSDLAAFGTTSVASNGLVVDVEAPGYVDRLPDWVSPVMVAEALLSRINNPLSAESKEAERVSYLRDKDPKVYASELLEVLRANL